MVRFGDFGVWYTVNPNKMWSGLVIWCMVYSEPLQNVVRFGDFGVWYTVNPNKMWSGLVTLVYGIQ